LYCNPKPNLQLQLTQLKDLLPKHANPADKKPVAKNEAFGKQEENDWWDTYTVRPSGFCEANVRPISVAISLFASSPCYDARATLTSAPPLQDLKKGELLTVNHGDGRKEVMRVVRTDKFPFILMEYEQIKDEYEQIHVRCVMADRADPGDLTEGMVPKQAPKRSAVLSKVIHDATLMHIRKFPTKMQSFKLDLENEKFFGAVSGVTDRFSFIDVFSPNMPRVFSVQLKNMYNA